MICGDCSRQKTQVAALFFQLLLSTPIDRGVGKSAIMIVARAGPRDEAGQAMQNGSCSNEEDELEKVAESWLSTGLQMRRHS